MMNIYANVGKPGNLAQSLLLTARKNAVFADSSALAFTQPTLDQALIHIAKTSEICFFLFFSAQTLQIMQTSYNQ